MLNYMKIFSTLDLESLTLISYTWCSYQSQPKEQAGKMKQWAEGKRQKGHGGRGGIWAMASGEVPGNSHHFGITWFKVVANVPSSIFLLKERPGNPSFLVPAKPWPVDGHCLSWGLFPPPYTFLPFLLLLFACQYFREDGTHQEKHENTLITRDIMRVIISVIWKGPVV